MHFVNHNFTDIDFETKHMSRIEKTIYFDLRSLYLSEESPIDGSDMDLLQRRLSVIDDAEKQALAFVLKDKFDKVGKLFKRPAWDKIIKDYKFQQISTALSDMTKRLRADGVTIEANAGMSAIRELYIQRFGGDKLTRITNKANVMTNEANVKANRANDKANVTTNEGEYKLTSNDERKFMVDSLKGVGESVTLKTSISTLRELYTKRFNSDSKVDATNAIHQANDMTNTNANAITNTANVMTNEINAENDTITINHEPLTNNQELSEREAHTNTGEGIIADAEDFELVTYTEEDTRLAEQKRVAAQAPVNHQSSKADQIRDQRADDIESWEAPTFKEMQDQLLAAGKQMNFTGTQYRMHVEDFKAHYSEQALLGKPVSTEANRKAKLRKWLMGEIDKQTANQARQEKARGTFNIDNEDWSGTTASNPTQSNSDMPDVFHPSHSNGTTDASQPLFLNGLKRLPFAGMTTDESYALVDKHTQIGEARVAAYDRLLNEMKEAV